MHIHVSLTLGTSGKLPDSAGSRCFQSNIEAVVFEFEVTNKGCDTCNTASYSHCQISSTRFEVDLMGLDPTKLAETGGHFLQLRSLGERSRRTDRTTKP